MEWSACGVLGWGLDTIAAIAPGGATAAVATPAATLQAFQWSSGTRIAGISNGSFGASAISYSSDGALFAATGNEGLEIWRVSDGALLRTIPAMAGGMLAGISTDGAVAAVAVVNRDRRRSLIISRPAGVLTLEQAAGLDSSTNFSGLVVSPDGGLVVLAYSVASGAPMQPFAYKVTAWKTADGTVAWSRSEGKSGFPPDARLAISSDGAHLEVGTFDNGLGGGGEVLNTADGTVVSSPFFSEVYGFSPDGAAVLGAGGSKVLALARISDGAYVQTYAAPPSGTTRLAAGFVDNNYHVESIVVSPTPADRPLLRIANDGTTVGQIARVSATNPVSSAVISPDAAWVATVSSSIVSLWSVASQSVAATAVAYGLAPAPLAFSPDSQRVAFVADASRMVTLQSVPTTGGAAVQIPVNATALAYSPAGDLLAVANPGDYSIGFWNPVPAQGTSTGTLVRTTVADINTKHTAFVGSVTFSPDGRLLASSSADGTIKIWNVSDGTLARTIVGSGNLTFSPDGTVLFSAGQPSPGLHAWDPATGTSIQAFQAQPLVVPAVPVFPPGEGTLLDVDQSNTFIDVLRLTDGSLSRTIPLSDGSVGLSLSSDGRTLASFGDAIVRLWCR